MEDWGKDDDAGSEVLLLDGDRGGERGLSSSRSQQQQPQEVIDSEYASTNIVQPSSANWRNKDNTGGIGGGSGGMPVEDEQGGEEDVLLVGDYMPDQELEEFLVEGAMFSTGGLEADGLDTDQHHPAVKVRW